MAVDMQAKLLIETSFLRSKLNKLKPSQADGHQNPKKRDFYALGPNSQTRNKTNELSQMSRTHTDQLERQEQEISITGMDFVGPSSFDRPEPSQRLEYRLRLKKQQSVDFMVQKRIRKYKSNIPVFSTIINGLGHELTRRSKKKNSTYSKSVREGIAEGLSNFIYLPESKRFGKNTVLACKDASTYLIARVFSGMSLMLNSKPEAICEGTKETNLRTLDALYVEGPGECDYYYYRAIDKLFFAKVRKNGGVYLGRFEGYSFDSVMEIDKEEQ